MADERRTHMSPRRFLPLCFGIVMFATGLASLVLVNSWRGFSAAAIVLVVSGALLTRRSSLRPFAHISITGLGAVVVVDAVVLQFVYSYVLFVILGFGLAVLGAFFLVSQGVRTLGMRRGTGVGPRGRRTRFAGQALTATVGAGAAAVAVVIMTIAVVPSIGVNLYNAVSGNAYLNSFRPDARSTVTPLSNGIVRVNDVKYGSTYPNSYLDIYRTDLTSSEPQPTLIYVHGGGYIAGDKYSGDTFAGSLLSEFYTSFVDAGVTVVSVNYAFAPQYVYPRPVDQINKAVQFLSEHAPEYGLDMSNVFFAGGSAGGQLAGQVAELQVDPAYADRVGIAPVLSPEDVNGVLLGSALLDPPHFDESGSWLIDYIWNVSGRAYWGNLYETNAAARQASLVENITDAYPPIFFNDGNEGTFFQQAIAFNDQLDGEDHPHVFSYWPSSVVALPHGFETDLTTPYGRENMRRMLTFVQDQLQ